MSTKLEKAPADMKGFLDSMKPRIADVLPEHIRPETMVRIFGHEISRNPKLALCTTESLISSIMTCSQLGLEPSSPLGLIYLIPRRNKYKGNRNEATILIGYKGLLALAQRSGKIARINAQVVYESEIKNGSFRFSWEPPKIEHAYSIARDGADQDIAAAYCVVETTEGAQYIEVINRDQIDKRRARSSSPSDGPWRTDYPSMARKSAIRALLMGGTVPLSSELAEALASDDDGIAEAVPGRMDRFAAAAVAVPAEVIEADAEPTTVAGEIEAPAASPMPGAIMVGLAEKMILRWNKEAGTRYKASAAKYHPVARKLIRAGLLYMDLEPAIPILIDDHGASADPGSCLTPELVRAALERTKDPAPDPDPDPAPAPPPSAPPAPPKKPRQLTGPWAKIEGERVALGLPEQVLTDTLRDLQLDESTADFWTADHVSDIVESLRAKAGRG